MRAERESEGGRANGTAETLDMTTFPNGRCLIIKFMWEKKLKATGKQSWMKEADWKKKKKSFVAHTTAQR